MDHGESAGYHGNHHSVPRHYVSISIIQLNLWSPNYHNLDKNSLYMRNLHEDGE
jgi:hypothetical protein